ncbi:MAG: response regulator [Rhizobiaceae bacterium]|nr:response regulator [Rhizobiaceae bacterium]MCV0409029.1 response regulator [Rhizobiaceae bacterium]
MTDLPLVDLRVLVVEDEFLIAMDIEQCCRDGGAAGVIICTDVTELGPDPWSESAFDVVVLDVMHAGKPSLDLAAALRDRGQPFVFATGYSGDDDLFADFPNVPIVPKPFAAEELLKALCEAVGRTCESGCV